MYIKKLSKKKFIIDVHKIANEYIARKYPERRSEFIYYKFLNTRIDSVLNSG